jgi:hypothetical protein
MESEAITNFDNRSEVNSVHLISEVFNLNNVPVENTELLSQALMQQGWSWEGNDSWGVSAPTLAVLPIVGSVTLPGAEIETPLWNPHNGNGNPSLNLLPLTSVSAISVTDSTTGGVEQSGALTAGSHYPPIAAAQDRTLPERQNRHPSSSPHAHRNTEVSGESDVHILHLRREEIVESASLRKKRRFQSSLSNF